MRTVARSGLVAVGLLALACAAGCKSQQPGAVNLTIVADPSLSDAQVASIRSLEIDASGAVTGSQSYVLPRSFPSGRQERIVVRPAATSGVLTLAVLARDAAGTAIAFGQTDVTLKSDAVAAEVLLTANVPGGDAGADGGVNVPSVRLLAGGIGGIGCVDGTGASARFNNPRGAVFAAGKLYLTDMYNQVIREVDPSTGAVKIIAGSPLAAGAVDKPGTQARFDRPNGITTDGMGNLYVTDMRNDTIRKIVIASGDVSTLAGTAGQTGAIDMPGVNARFDHPHGIVYDGAGNLYVADTHNHTIRKIVIAGAVVSTLAGTAGQAGAVDMPGANARFDKPHALAFENGSVFVADATAHTVRQIVVAGAVVSTLAGTAGQIGSADGTGANARLHGPRGLVADGAGHLYVADSDNNRLRKIVISTGDVTTVAGQGYSSQDGIGAGAGFEGPMAVSLDAGTLFVVDGWGQMVRKVSLASTQVTTLAGAAQHEGLADGTGAAARFKRPHGITVVGGSVFVADKRNDAVRKIDIASGRVTTLAGGRSGSADGTGDAASFRKPWGIASDGTDLFVSDSDNHTIRKIVIATGATTTLAGAAGQPGSTTDVKGAAARFNQPAGLAFAAGTLYVADSNNDTIRAIDVASTMVTTLAGSPGQLGSMDGMGAAARFNGPVGVAVEGGVLYVTDQNNHTVRSVTLPGGEVATPAGSPGVSGGGDGPGSTARFFMPAGLAGDGAGHLFIADTRNHTVRKLDVATTMVSTFAGTAGVGAVQPGPLPGAINTPSGIALASDGTIVVTTTHENAILLLQ